MREAVRTFRKVGLWTIIFSSLGVRLCLNVTKKDFRNDHIFISLKFIKKKDPWAHWRRHKENVFIFQGRSIFVGVKEENFCERWRNSISKNAIYTVCFGGSLIRCFNMREKREREKKNDERQRFASLITWAR